MSGHQTKLVPELGQQYQLRCGAKVILKGYTSCFTCGDVLYQKMFADLIDGFDLLPEREQDFYDMSGELVVVASPIENDPLDIVCKI